MDNKVDAGELRQKVKDTAEAIAQDIESGLVRRDEPHDCIFEETDALFGSLVKMERVDRYTVDDMIDTIGSVATILRVAREDAWLPDDSGLWEGITPFGIPASVAFFALENCLWQKLRDMNVVE